jgi:polysaccharide biosynthesis/export protein
VIGPEDVLDVSVWKEPEVSRVVPVRPRRADFASIDPRCASSGTFTGAIGRNGDREAVDLLNEPKVTVIVTAMNSQRVFVVGEVLRAGAFPLLPGMTILQAISSAGGFTTFADVKKIHVVRMRDGKQVELPFNYRDVLKGDKPEQNINLDPGDTIVAL